MAESEQELSTKPRRHKRSSPDLALQAPQLCQGLMKLYFRGRRVAFPARAAPEPSTGTDAPTLS